MAKEYTWHITLDGVEHCVTCQVVHNHYDLFVDDDHLTRLLPKSASSETVEDIEILGHPCKFVLWNYVPDLVRDDTFVSSGKRYSSEKKSRAKVNLVGGIALCCLALWWIISWALGLKTSAALVSGVLLLAVGVWRIIDIRKKA